MTLRSIQVIECLGSLFLFIAEYYSIQYVYHDLSSYWLENIWVVSSFWGITNKVRLFIYFYVNKMFSFSGINTQGCNCWVIWCPSEPFKMLDAHFSRKVLNLSQIYILHEEISLK